MNEILHRIPFIRILASYLAGIITAQYFSFSDIKALLFFLFLLWAVTLYLNIRNNCNIIPFLLSFFLFVAGVLNFQKNNLKPAFSNGTYYMATLLEYPIRKQNSYKAEILLTNVFINDSVLNTREKLLVYFEPDSLQELLQPGGLILFKAQPNEISNPGNPNEFNFKGYLSNKKIYRQVYLTSEKWINCGLTSHIYPRIISEKIRHRLLNIYLENNISGERFAILSALTLGYKDALDPETKQVFSSSGAMHVLAVSGLHVGIIFLAVNLIFGFLRHTRKGKVFFIALSILTLWGYAFITGLSPSVLRATVMFCFLIIGENLRRPANIYNTLFLSAFILLFINPNLLFDVGFQLSYSAVFGIVFFQPKINNWFSFNNRLASWAWALFSVSIAAQLATFPLTLYYFNQFPTYFWVSNFIVIPGAFIFIFLGIGICLFSFIPFISSVLSTLTSISLDGIFYVLSKIQELPVAVVRNIHINNFQLVLLILVLILLMFFVSFKKTKYLFLLFSSIIVFFSINITQKIYCHNQNKIIIYNSGNGKLIHLISGRKNYVLYETQNQIASFDMSLVENVKTKNYLAKTTFIKLDSVYEDNYVFLKNGIISFLDKIVWINNTGETELPDINIDFILTEKSPIKNLTDKTKIIMAGLLRYKDEKNPEYFYLKKDGAFIFNF